MAAGRQRRYRAAPVFVRNADDVSLLVATLGDPDPVLRRHAASALARIGNGQGLLVLRGAISRELDEGVLAELLSAMASSR